MRREGLPEYCEVAGVGAQALNAILAHRELCSTVFRTLFCGHHQRFLASRGSRSRHFNNEGFKVFLWSVDYWLIWQLFRWFIPWSSRLNSTRKSLRDQFADFLSL